MEKTIKPIGYIRTGFKDKFGVPRQSGRAPSVQGTVILGKEYGKTSVRGLEEVSHVWLIFGFNKTEYTGAQTVRPPRLGGNKRVGVFATRSPNRPNGLGISCVKLDKIEVTARGVELTVSGVDLIDGTPVYDIKPYNPADKIDGAYCGFADKNTGYKLKVEFSDKVKDALPESVIKALKECLEEDPRPSYIEDGERVYGITYENYNVKFTVSNGVITVLSAERLKLST